MRRRLTCESLEARQLLDASAPAILQIFESTHTNTEQRAADIFEAGYGAVWVPPTGRADSGNQSVGYDVFDRFDLGGPGNHTLYGTETGFKQLVDVLHAADMNVYPDFVVNHNGFSDLGRPNFVAEGDYPGFVLTLGNDIDGDFHSGFDTGDLNGRLAGLIDIAHEKNHQFIRHPTQAGDPSNIPSGTIWDQPDPDNARFYPDQSLTPIMLFDPKTGQTDIPVYPFNTADPLAGDPVSENALGLLMRNAQWMIQEIGVDGFRLDAAKHVESWVLEFLDRAVYRAIQTPQLDGSTEHAFMFSEIFTGDKGFIQSLIRKDIDPGDPGRIGGNRDALDFPLFFAMNANLTSNGFVNDWRNIKNASQDIQDDGFANNGSQGVAFVNSHDEHGPDLGNVAHAYVLMRPGNAVIYFNAEQFGTGRDFPKDGRGDALGGQYGDAITTLVGIRNTHGRGDYIDRTDSADEKEILVFERSASAVTVLSNRVDAGFDARTYQTNFLPGTPLIELTGNAANSAIDPFNDFPEVVVVNPDGTANLRVPRNVAPDGNAHNSGYFIYGPSGPQGSLSLTNVDFTLGPDSATPATNGTSRVSSIDVISSDTFQVALDTTAVSHLGSIRDTFADGDNALLKIDAGVDLNGNGVVDFTGIGGPSTGFEEFTTLKVPGYFEADGNGQYRQDIDATALSEGMHFLEVRAFRHREPGEGDAIYTSFKKSIYVDRLDPVSEVASFDPIVPGVNENREVLLRSTDLTADNMHVFLDLPAGLSDAEILGMLDSGSQTNSLDRDLYSKQFSGITSGNHVITVVTFEISGNVNIQRFPGLATTTIFGSGLGDLDFDGDVDSGDMSLMQTIYQSANEQFNPAADFNGDGLVDINDLPLMYEMLISTGNTGATFDAFDQFVVAEAPVDYGDAPDTFGTLQASNGPHHILTVGPFMGTSADTDSDGQPTADADGDDNDENNDDNGLVSATDLLAGLGATLTVNVSGEAKLDAWVDFNDNGQFDHPAEHLGGGTSIDVVAGDNAVNFTVPIDAVTGDGNVRLRVSSFGSLSPLSLAGDGEVEDYQVGVTGLPFVQEVTINGDGQSRSHLTSIEVLFSDEVDAPTSAFSLKNLTTDTDVTTLDVTSSSTAEGKTLAVIKFDPGPSVVDRDPAVEDSLDDGNYELTIDGAQIIVTGTPLEMASDYQHGTIASHLLFRWFTDSDGDRDSDTGDLIGFAQAFRSQLGHANYNPEYDLLGDGDVDTEDLIGFAQHFRRGMPFGS